MQILDKIDSDLSDGRKFLVGDHYSMADLVATCLLANIHFGKQETLFSENVQAYWVSMKSRNSFASAPILYKMEDFDTFEPYINFRIQVNMATGLFVILGLGIVIRQLTKKNQDNIFGVDSELLGETMQKDSVWLIYD